MALASDVFRPDLIVTADDGSELLLVVEAKLHLADPAQTELQLKHYMIWMRCPVGLLVTPDRIRIYRNRYLSDSEESVSLVGEFTAPADWSWLERSASLHARPSFEDHVRGWLEGLAGESARKSLPNDLRNAVDQYLLPVLNQGIVRAAGPRHL